MTVITEVEPLVTGRPPSDDAVWLGAIDITTDFADEVTLGGAEGFGRAGVLVRSDTTVVGYAEWPIESPVVHGARLRDVADHARVLADDRDARGRTPRVGGAGDSGLVSVVICTRDRPEALRRTVDSVLASDHPSFEVIIVDNASIDLEADRLVAELDDPRVRAAHAFVPGISTARNVGIRVARGSIVAFVDDDVLVDSTWLSRLVRHFDRPRVACVTGLVPTRIASAALLTDPDATESWIQPLAPREFRLDTPPRDRLFPFRVGQFGCGANFAVRRAAAFALGGFDERLGVGTSCGAGEDIDWFVRTIAHGHSLVFDPDAVVCHQRQPSHDEALADSDRRDVGLGALIMTSLTDRRTARLALRRLPAGSQRMLTILREGAGAPTAPVGRRGSAVLAGAGRLARAHLEGRSSRPLRHFADIAPHGFADDLGPRRQDAVGTRPHDADRPRPHSVGAGARSGEGH